MGAVHVMRCPADLVEAGDRIARNATGPWAKVTRRKLRGELVILDVEVDHGNGVEREVWRPRYGTEMHLEYLTVARIRNFAQRAPKETMPVDAVCKHCGHSVHKRPACRIGNHEGTYWAHLACEQWLTLLEG